MSAKRTKSTAPAAPVIESVPIDSVSQDPANARRHPERNLETIKGSLRRFGQQRPILVDRNGVIIAGNGTHQAAQALGWPTILVVRTDLEGAEAIAYGIADNKTAELAEWDYQELSALLRGLPADLRLDTGFADFELGPLLETEWRPPPKGQGGESQEPVKTVGVTFTTEQMEVIDRAVAEVRRQAEDVTVPIGRAIELVCADWLSGQPQHETPTAHAGEEQS